MADDRTIADGYEMFSDPCYYDMIAVRKIGEKRFDHTHHVTTVEEAIDWSHRQKSKES